MIVGSPALQEVDADGVPSFARRPYRRDRIRRRRRRSRSRKEKHVQSGSDAEDDAAEFHPHHAKDVPREVNLSSAFPGDCDGADSQDATTMMLRHIPCRYTQATLLREIDQRGFEGCYDFFYLPMDVRNKTSVGYCFINLLDSSRARAFADVFGAYEFQRHRSDKIGEVSPAKIQGLRHNISHFFGRAVLNARDSKRRPIVLQNGFRCEFGDVLANLERLGPDKVHRVGRPDMQACPRAPARPLNPMAEEFVPQSLKEAAAETFVPQAVAVVNVEVNVTEDLSEDGSGDSSWVARAFEHLIDDLPFAVMAKESSFGGGWIEEAFKSLAGNDVVGGPLKRWPSAFEQSLPQQNSIEGSWVSDAFRSLVIGIAKKPAVEILLEASPPSPIVLTPRDALQRLRGLGGWAWVAFD